MYFLNIPFSSHSCCRSLYKIGMRNCCLFTEGEFCNLIGSSGQLDILHSLKHYPNHYPKHTHTVIPIVIPNRWAYAIIPLLVSIRLLCTLFQIKWIPTDQPVCCLFGQTNEDVPWGDSRLGTSLYWYSGHIYNYAIKHYLFVISIYLIIGKITFLIFIFRVAKCSATRKIYSTTNCCSVCLSLLFGLLRILTSLFTKFSSPSSFET